ncbi:hypothetical protein D7c_00045 [Klebsiella phage VLCpiD7c]|nr:hypothetical protein D7c_00045 [Klebsiella phage VLCpiD7c]
MIHEIKSGKQVVATIKKRRVVAFQINIPDPDDTQSIDVPIWANTIAIDADGAIWAYESTAEEVRIVGGQGEAWCDGGKAKNRLDQIGVMARVPDWAKSKIDLRGLK